MSNRSIPLIGCLLLSIVAFSSCSKNEQEQVLEKPEKEAAVTAAGPEPGVDYHSFANTGDYLTRHLELDLAVDFTRKVLAGTATLHFDTLQDTGKPLILDTRAIAVKAVRAGTDSQMQTAEFTVGPADEILGEPLMIDLPPGADRVAIDYETSPGASGLQWLEPRQTAGKQHPFLFSQAQAIHARSFIPLQDTPGVRITYDATIHTRPELRAVMSADNDPAAEKNGTYVFNMPQPIPSYLLAIAVGDLEFKAMGERTGVYAEKELLEASAKEFEDTESMLEITEDMYGPYAWDRYDLLILPPSFPFGGMENPRLSFITPTVLAGDKSLVALIAHELAHSWSGNLVTNSSWRDLWLNEGFTTYLTNRIMQNVFGDQRYRMEMVLSYADLEADLADLDEPDQVLAMDKRGRDPDEAFSSIPYDKGSLFLYELEQQVGRDTFDAFLLDYFNKYAFQSLSTEDFLEHFKTTLLRSHGEMLDEDRIREWIYEPGLPDGAPVPESDAFSKIEPQVQGWLAGTTGLEEISTDDWTYHQWKFFLDGMPDELSTAQLTELDDRFSFTDSTNNEIAFSWLRIAIRNDYQPAFARLEDFLLSIGRNKFLMPLYQELMDSGNSEFAVRVFEQAKPGYHPLTVKRNGAIVYPDAEG
ncbi:MAG: M1 family metallopeptidase [Gammaproteobacteria bacterium]|nr:M1 family metallopeptidase [Gammaproteobacteria bacterium]